MIPNFKTYIKESVWNDIRRRGNGTDIKKEDDINNMDMSEFCNYLYLNYWPTEWNDGETIDQFPSPIHDNTLKIQVPLIHIPKPSGVGYFVPPITMCFNGGNEKLFDVILSSKLIDKYPDTEKILGVEYKFEYPQKNLPTPHIVKKNGQMTNTDCVKIINRLLDMVDKPLFRKNS